MKSRILYIHVQCSLHSLLKAWTTTDNIFLSHSYILTIFPPKSLFTITLKLICITLSHHIVRESFLSPLHCIVLQEKCHFPHWVSVFAVILGDNDSILLVLLIPRLNFKLELLQSQLKLKVSYAWCNNLETRGLALAIMANLEMNKILEFLAP